MKFVIVEDELRIREGIARLLPKLNENYIVSGEAENGAEGLELIRREQPDVVITDVRMPVMDGLEMLKTLHEEHIHVKAIVLSAYSEFEYARTAIHLGVTEYLLKPVNSTEFREAVERVKTELESERSRKPDQIGSIKQLVRNILAGELELEDEVVEYLEREFNLRKDMPLALFVAHFESWSKQESERLQRKLRFIVSGWPELSFCIMSEQGAKEVRILLYGYKDGHAVKRWIQGHFLQRESAGHRTAMGWTECENIYRMKENYCELERYLDWTITLGDDVIISYPEITRVQTEFCAYPAEIENQMKLAVCSGQRERVRVCVEKFHNYFQGRVYEPDRVKDCYARFFWALINFEKETGNPGFANLEQRVLLDSITEVKTKEGIHCITENLLKKVEDRTDSEIGNLVVKRAVGMVHEYYRNGITLEEIAQRLGITPEYLGTQFHQEMKVNFSTYIKTFRMNKAKELLLGTQLKMYEIAERVGYSDPKYFSRVFKAETGQLPVEYRRSHK